MNNPGEDHLELAEQLRLLAERQALGQYRESDSGLPQFARDQLEAMPNPSQLFPRPDREERANQPPSIPGASFDAAELLRQMAQLPQHSQPAGEYQADPQRVQALATSQPATEHPLTGSDQWQSQTLRDLISCLPGNQLNQHNMQSQLQRLANSPAQDSIPNVLSDLHAHTQQAPQQIGAQVGQAGAAFSHVPHHHFNPAPWQDALDTSGMDMHGSSAAYRQGNVPVSMDRREGVQPAEAGLGVNVNIPPAGARLPPVPSQPPPTQEALAPQPPQLSQGKGTVLAAKTLTESDVKHSRAILPRVAVENNLPFLLGYRTFGMYLPDEQGNRWEFVVKSWANGRADKTGQQTRRKDRRVYVVEQMAQFLAKHQLHVGDVVGIVHVDGHLEMHCQTTALKAWIDRPTYGAPPLDTFPTPVPGKCALLEDSSADPSRSRCTKSSACTKPDRHAGPCDTSADGSAARIPGSLGSVKLKLWPQPTCPPPPEDIQVSSLPELQPQFLLEGALVTFRVTQEMLQTGIMEMPAGHVVKVPENLSSKAAFRMEVQLAASEHTFNIVFATSQGPEAPAAAPPVAQPEEGDQQHQGGPGVGNPGVLVPRPLAGRPQGPGATAAGAGPGGVNVDGMVSAGQGLPSGFLPGGGGHPGGEEAAAVRAWRICGLLEVLAAVNCNVADEICIEKGEKVLVSRLSSTHLPPLPATTQPVNAPTPGTFSMFLCQRTQGCMKNENHTGFCSGHRGFKRKNVAAGEDGGGAGRRKSGGKGRAAPPPNRAAAEAKASAAAAAAAARWPGVQEGGAAAGMLGRHPEALSQPPQVPRPKPELSAAADVLVAMAGTQSAAALPPGSLPAEQLVMPALQRASGEGQWQSVESLAAAHAQQVAAQHAVPPPGAGGQPPPPPVGQEGAVPQRVPTEHDPGFLNALLQTAADLPQQPRGPLPPPQQ